MPAKTYKPDAIKHMFHRYIVGEESQWDAINKVGGECRAFCPVCEEPGVSDSPSASINVRMSVWRCLGKCQSKGSVGDLVAQLKEARGFNSRAEMMKGRNKDEQAVKPGHYKDKPKAMDEDDIIKWGRRLHNSPRMATLQEERGLTEATITAWGIGWDGSRYTIPVRDGNDELQNVRRYTLKAGAKGDKMLNIPGRGEARIFAPTILEENETIVLSEGEMDCILLNQYGIPAVTHTAGAATFKREWGPLFTGKTVYVCYDNDDGGRQGAAKAAKIISSFTEHVFVMEIPIPVKGADVTDFFHKEGRTKEDFQELMKRAKPFNVAQLVQAKEAPTTGRTVSLEASMAEEYSKEVVELTVTVAGKQNPPYYVPKRFSVNCDMSKGAVCQVCPVFERDGQLVQEMAPNDASLFRFVDINEDRHGKVLREISGARCSDRSELAVEEVYTMEELTVGNSVDAREVFEDQKPITRHIFSVGTHKTDVNTVVKIVGQNTTNPKNGRASFMAWRNDPVQTSLDSFVIDRDEFHELSIFKPRVDDDGVQSALDKCLEIARDMSANVTRIYGRDLLHVAYDLVWHSPLAFMVEGRMIEKGWLEMMAVGDTRTGKSEMAIQLARHYRSGIVKSCEGATFAGLVGGAQQIGTAWMTTWGVIPLNDRRLVVLDEVSGLKDREVIENMSSIRSSGRAQLTKISTEETSARTRLIWITNPADGSMIDEKPGVGMDALRTVVKANEDIARFDYVIAARASEVDSAVINSVHDEGVPHVFDSELSARLVLWVWSLKPEQIRFTPGAEKRARELAQEISNEYIPDPPLLQTENARFKLYRIAAAIACRTFANEWKDKDLPEVLVRRDHIEDAKKFLDLIYDSGAMQYRSRSRKILAGREMAKQRRYACKMYLLEHEDTVLAALRAIGSSTFKVRDFREFANMTEDHAQTATKHLLNWKMIHRKSRGDITMDRVLVDILRELEDED